MTVERFRKMWESGDIAGLADLYTDDAVLDMNLPQWRFQVQGPTAITKQFQGYFERGPITVLSWKERAAEWGGVVEEETNWAVEPETLYYRQIHVLVTSGEQIAEHVIYCPGEWDQAAVARQRKEAPMIRP